MRDYAIMLLVRSKETIFAKVFISILRAFECVVSSSLRKKTTNNEQDVQTQWRRFERLNEENQRDLRSFTNGINFQALREKHSRKSRGLLVLSAC